MVASCLLSPCKSAFPVVSRIALADITAHVVDCAMARLIDSCSEFSERPFPRVPIRKSIAANLWSFQRTHHRCTGLSSLADFRNRSSASFPSSRHLVLSLELCDFFFVLLVHFIVSLFSPCLRCTVLLFPLLRLFCIFCIPFPSCVNPCCRTPLHPIMSLVYEGPGGM